MLDIQNANIYHLSTLKGTYDIKTVRAYNGEFGGKPEEAARKLTTLKPAVFVVADLGQRYPGTDQCDIELYIVADSAYSAKTSRTTALEVLHWIEAWLMDDSDPETNNLYWEYDGEFYGIDFDWQTPFDKDVLAITDKFTVARLMYTSRKV